MLDGITRDLLSYNRIRGRKKDEQDEESKKEQALSSWFSVYGGSGDVYLYAPGTVVCIGKGE